jgi:hypothetical protein
MPKRSPKTGAQSGGRGRWPAASRVPLPLYMWKGLDPGTFSRTKRKAFEAGDQVAPFEAFAMMVLGHGRVPRWAAEYLAHGLARFLVADGARSLDEVFSMMGGRGQTSIKKRLDLVVRDRQLTYALHQLIVLGVKPDRAAQAVRHKLKVPIAGTTLLDLYYRDGWKRILVEVFKDDVLRAHLDQQRAMILRDYHLG